MTSWYQLPVALKPRIFHNVAPREVSSRLPKEFRALVNPSVLRESSYTVIAFPATRGSSTSIVDSATLGRALLKCVSGDAGLVAVAHSFTIEAQKLLDAGNGRLFEKSDFHWTDDSWARIRDKYS